MSYIPIPILSTLVGPAQISTSVQVANNLVLFGTTNPVPVSTTGISPLLTLPATPTGTIIDCSVTFLARTTINYMRMNLQVLAVRESGSLSVLSSVLSDFYSTTDASNWVGSALVYGGNELQLQGALGTGGVGPVNWTVSGLLRSCAT